MKLVRKLTLTLLTAMCLVLAIAEVVRERREMSALEADSRLDHLDTGHVLVGWMGETWRTRGRDAAVAMLRSSPPRRSTLEIRWLEAKAAMPAGAPSALASDDAALGSSPESSPESRVTEDPRGWRRRLTRVPLVVDGVVLGAIEFDEVLAAERGYLHASVVDAVLTVLAVVVVLGMVAMWLGTWFVGRPVKALVAKARRVGAGDFSSPLDLRAHDELGLLAAEMNAMCERLVQAHGRAETEKTARLSTLEQLRHADRLSTIGTLASAIAHELGTPLNVISGRAGMIARGGISTEETTKAARAIIDASQRMTKIIRQLLDFARRRGPQKSRHKLPTLAEQTIALLAPLADKRGVTLTLVVESPDVEASIDAGQIEQALTNLVMNAIQAMPSGGQVDVVIGTVGPEAAPAGHVTNGGRPADGYASITVRDRGQGIAPEHLQHIFEPFFTTKRVGEGTGLGLSVTHGIVREHDGWINVHSTPDGAEFSILLPKG